MSPIASVGLTYWKHLLDPQGQRAVTTWAKLLARLSVPKTHAIKLDIPGFALATFKGERRSLANVERVYALGLDLDEAVVWPEVRTLFSTCASFVHSTWSSTLTDPRARVFLLLSRPVTAEEYRLVYASVAAKAEAGGLIVDRASSDASRLWFLPATRHGAPFVSYVGDGDPVNVEAALAAAPPREKYVPKPRSPRAGSAYARARAYLAQVPGAVSGNGGHKATFVIAMRLVRSFCLSTDDAFDLLASEWNERCSPPWSERELHRKVEQAANDGRLAEGDM